MLRPTVNENVCNKSKWLKSGKTHGQRSTLALPSHIRHEDVEGNEILPHQALPSTTHEPVCINHLLPLSVNSTTPDPSAVSTKPQQQQPVLPHCPTLEANQVENVIKSVASIVPPNLQDRSVSLESYISPAPRSTMKANQGRDTIRPLMQVETVCPQSDNRGQQRRSGQTPPINE